MPPVPFVPPADPHWEHSVANHAIDAARRSTLLSVMPDTFPMRSHERSSTVHISWQWVRTFPALALLCREPSTARPKFVRGCGTRTRVPLSCPLAQETWTGFAARRDPPGVPHRPRILRTAASLVGTAMLGVATLGACMGSSAPASPGFDAVAAGGSGFNSSLGPNASGTPAGVGRNLRRLSAREYNNVVRDLLADATQPANQFGQEVYTNGFDNGSDSLTVQGTDVVAFQAAAETLRPPRWPIIFPHSLSGATRRPTRRKPASTRS
jgi:hypothetical protein